MNVHIRIEASTRGIEVHSAMADGPVGQAAPDHIVQDILMKAWQIMFAQGIVKTLQDTARIQPADVATLKRLPRIE